MLVTSYSYPRCGRHMCVNAYLAFDPVWTVDGAKMEMVSVAIHQFGEANGYKIRCIHKNLNDLKNDVPRFCSAKSEIYVAAEHGNKTRHCGKHFFIVRNPWDAVLSYSELVLRIDAKERNKKHDINKVAEDFVSGNLKYEGHARMTWHAWYSGFNDGPFLRYEDMMEDQVGAVQTVLGKIGIEVEKNGSPPTLEQCRSKNDTYYRVGKIGRGKESLPPHLVDRISVEWKEQIERFGYE